MSDELSLQDELPFDARVLIEQVEAELADVRARAERESNEVRARTDQAILEIRTQADEDLHAIQERSEKALTEALRRLVTQLKPMQEAHVREGKLDEALAIRDRIRQIKSRRSNLQPDPGNLANFQPSGEDLLFDVVGSTDGPVWGTDVYTSDSRLSAAAVHAGILHNGQRGAVRVSLVHGFNITFTGSLRNGVLSHDYGEYPVAFRIARA